MSQQAYTGSPPEFVPACNIHKYIFSNPFREDSEVIRNAPNAENRVHTIPTIDEKRPIFIDPLTNAQLTWEGVREASLRVITSLIALGVVPRDAPSKSTTATQGSRGDPIISPVVLVHLPNCLAYAPILTGIFALGATATLASPSLSPSELAHIVQQSRPRVLISSVDGWDALAEGIRSLENGSEMLRIYTASGKAFVVDGTASGYEFGSPLSLQNKKPVPQGTRPWWHLLDTAPYRTFPQMSAEESHRRIAVIMWSSGTSGKSKGVLLSHAAITSSLAGLWHVNPTYDAHERWLGFVPFFHIFGLLNQLLISMCCGATVYVMPRFEPRAMLELAQKFAITYLHIAPPVAVVLAKSPVVEEFDLSSVRGAVSGGAPLGSEVIELVYRRLGVLVKMGYGLTEAVSVSNQVGKTWEDIEPQLGNSGVPLYGVELKIVSLDDATTTLKMDEEGEILIRSPSIMHGYLENAEATAEALTEDGWFRTGDVGKIDKNGHLWITDRLKDLIKVKGYQVSSADLEAVLCASPLVADAGVASVYSEDDATEYPRAFVVPKAPELFELSVPSHSKEKARSEDELKNLAKEIRKWVEGKAAWYKWPRGNIVFVQQIPKSPSGKILRKELRGSNPKHLGVEVQIYDKREKDDSGKRSKQTKL